MEAVISFHTAGMTEVDARVWLKLRVSFLVYGNAGIVTCHEIIVTTILTLTCHELCT